MKHLAVTETIARLCEASQVLSQPLETPLNQALGRVLAADVLAPIDVPPADNSAMDGYAFRHRDWPGEESALAISQRIPAGSPPPVLKTGTAARIFTGAEIPEGADTVVIAEENSKLRQAAEKPPAHDGRYRSIYIPLPRTGDGLMTIFSATTVLQRLALRMSELKMNYLDRLGIREHGVHPDVPKNVSKSITVD